MNIFVRRWARRIRWIRVKQCLLSPGVLRTGLETFGRKVIKETERCIPEIFCATLGSSRTALESS